jgi:hypothetical protein
MLLTATICEEFYSDGWQTLAQASMRVATMPALVLKRSSRAMPGSRVQYANK